MRRPFKPLLIACTLLFGISQLLLAQDNKLSLEDFAELEAKVVSVAEKCMAASVGLGSKERPENGSAVVVSKDGLLLTAYHVVEGLPDNNMIVSFVDGKKVRAKKLGGVPKLDIAMAQIIDKGDYPFVDIGDMDAVKNGDWCVSIAHAEGFQADRTPPVRLGRVVNRINPGGFLQMTSTLIGGDSGGPTFDLEGKVIGIHSNIGGSLSQNQACPISDFTKKDHWQRLLDGEVWGKPGEEAKKKAEAEKKKKEAEKKKKDNEKKEGEANRADARGQSEADSDGNDTNGAEGNAADKPDSSRGAEEKREMKSKAEQDPEKADEGAKPKTDSGKEEASQEGVESGNEKPESGAQDESESEDPEKVTSKKSRPAKLEPTSLDAFDGFASSYKESIVRFWRRGRMICSGLILTQDGIIVTKSSELMSRNFEVELPNGELVDAKVLKRVKENDLLFVQVDRSFAKVMDLSQDEELSKVIKSIPLGSIVVAVGFGGEPVSMGVKSVELRNLMQAGYAVLGVQLGTKQDDLSIKGLPGDSAAKKAGMRPGDIIKKIGGTEMKTLDQLREQLRALEPNTRVPVEFERDGRVAASLVKLGSSAARGDKGSMNYPQGGRISRKRLEFTEALQSDTPFDPKHVGGPLIDLNGRLLGINIARAGRIKSYTLPFKTIFEELRAIEASGRED